MTVRPLALIAALALGTSACDKIPFLGGGDDADTTTADTTAMAAAPAPDTMAPPPVQAPPPRPVASRPLVDEPWTPIDTGTVSPGMSREDVVAVWGIPVAERQTGSRGYLYFRNGCEVSCGTFDVVFLENGQVVDVIARGPGHHYAGTSSSPAGRVPEPTPASTMTMPPDSTSADLQA